MKHRLLFWLVLLLSAAWAHTSAAAIITTTITNTIFCKGATVQVRYTVDVPFDAANVFTAQLSDETGSFTAPVSIGALAGTAGGTITATLPQNAVTGSAYRIRVVASSPSTVGSDNGTDLTITNIGAVTAGSNSPLCVGGNLLLTATAVPGASYSWTGPAGFTSLLQNPTIANVGLNRSGTYTVTASVGSCTSTSQVAVTVNALPVASVSPQNPTICSGQSVTLNASGGTSYQWSPATGLSSTTVASPIASPTASTIYTVTVTNAAGCQATSQVTVNVRATPTLTVSTDQTICAGTSVTLSATGAQNYTWTPSTGLNNPRSATPIASPTTTTTYTVTGDNNGCQATAQVTVTVTPTPTPNAGLDRVLCSGQSTVLGAAPVAGLTYSWSPSTGLSATNVAQPTATLTNTTNAPRTTTYTLTTVTAGGCVGSSTVRVTTNPALTANAGPDRTFCSGGSAQLGSAAITGYSYQWSPATGLSSATAAQPTVTLTNTTGAPITQTYTVTASLNGCTATSQVMVTVNPATSATFSYQSPSYCQSSANPTPTVAGTAGGTFSSTSGLSLNAQTGQINLAASTPGTYTVTYSVGGPCSSTSSQTVTIATPGAAGFGYAASAYCASGANPSPTLNAGAAAGTFTATPAGLSLNASTGAINLAGSQPGTYTITNTVAANGACPAATASTQVTVSAVPAAALAVSGSTTFCQGSSVTLTANGGGAGATYQFLLNGQPISGATAATYAATQSGGYSVVITNPGNCTATSAAVTLTATPVTTPTVAYGAPSYCQNAGTNPAPTVSVAGGTFSSTTGLSLNASTGAINLAASTPGTYTVSYSTGSSCPGTGTASVTISPAPSAAFSYGTSTFCQNGSNPAPSLTGTSGGTFSASASGLSLNASTGAINLAASTPGTYTVSYNVGTGCPATSTATVTVTTAPAATFGYPAGSYCAAALSNVAPTFSGGGSAGTFSSTTGLSLDPATGIVNLAASQPGTYTVTNSISASGSCAAVSATASITIGAAPAATLTAGGSATICQGSSVTLTAPAGSGLSYQFLLNGQPISGATAATYNAAAPGSYAVVVTNAGGCAATSAAIAVAVTPATSAAFSYPAGSYCQGGGSGSVTPSITGTTGGTFAAGTGLSLNAQTGAINPATSTPGSYTVTYSVGGPCPSSSTANIVISAPATAAFSYASASLCASGSAPATLGAGATAGSFTSTNGLSLNAQTGAINLAASTPGTYTVTNTVAATGACGAATATATVTISALPAAPTVSVQYNGPTTTLTSSAAPTGGSYQWFLGGQPISGATAQTYVVTGSAQFGSYTVVVTSAQGCASPASAPLTVTAAAKPLAATTLELYPNPTSTGRLTLTLSGYAKPLELTVLDAVGRAVYRTTLRPAASGTTQELDLSPLPVGAYLLRASSADGTLIRRVVRE